MKFLVLLAAGRASAVFLRSAESACDAVDLKHRVELQNKLAGVCEDMCKEVGAYPKCTQCPKFVQPDATPNVMTWPELNDHMGNLVAWGEDQLKGWHAQANLLQVHQADSKHRVELQNKLAGVCEEMCKEVGSYPKCTQCPKFVQPDATPNVMTWPELHEHMGNLVAWGEDQLKGWHAQAKFLQVQQADTKHRVALQNKLAGVCEDMCKEVGSYPKCTQCPKFVQPDATPNVMTWTELNDHMGNLVAWGEDQLKGWHAQANLLQLQGDTKHRVELQNKLAGVCEDMCKEVGAYPKCTQCPKFVQPDATPNVMTWTELNDHMGNLVAWGEDQLKGWHAQANLLQVHQADMKHRIELQNKLAGVCEDMCKEVGAYPKCTQCPKFVQPDATPNVMTWAELHEHMGNLVAWGEDQIKTWESQAGTGLLQLQLHQACSDQEWKSVMQKVEVHFAAVQASNKKLHK